jgi:serine/threonine-protein kinase
MDTMKEKKKKTKKNKKNRNIKRKIIGVLLAIVVLSAMFTISFIIAGGNKKVEASKETKVPEINDMTINQAKVALEREGLILIEAGSEKSSKPEGDIIWVEPSVGSTVQVGDEIRVIISSGDEKIVIPDFKSSNLEEVKAFFKKNGITDVNYIEQFDEKIAASKIIKIEPAASTKITKTTKVTVYTSKGKDKKLVKVPDLTGYDSAEAKTNLESLGLKVTIKNDEKITDKNKDGKVLSQNIKDASLEVGQGVILTVGKYVEGEIVSQNTLGLLTDMGKEAAIGRITDNGLTYKTETEGTKLVDWSPKDRDLKKGEKVTLYLK